MEPIPDIDLLINNLGLNKPQGQKITKYYSKASLEFKGIADYLHHGHLGSIQADTVPGKELRLLHLDQSTQEKIVC